MLGSLERRAGAPRSCSATILMLQSQGSKASSSAASACAASPASVPLVCCVQVGSSTSLPQAKGLDGQEPDDSEGEGQHVKVQNRLGLCVRVCASFFTYTCICMACVPPNAVLGLGCAGSVNAASESVCACYCTGRCLPACGGLIAMQGGCVHGLFQKPLASKHFLPSCYERHFSFASGCRP